jgi:hypothetical protein
MFPNVTLEASSDDNRFVFQGGWTGNIRRTSYQYLASLNHFLDAPTELKNTWLEEIYAGLKGALGDHFTYSTKFSVEKYKNQPLFIQAGYDTTGKTYEAVYESDMRAIRYQGEIAYTEQEKFSATAGFNFVKYIEQETYDKAFGLIPIEFKAGIRVQAMKDLWIKSDMSIWQGPQYMRMDATRSSDQLKGSIDLNAGIEFRITKNLNLWAQFNNIFNREYQFYNQYPSYGFNFLGGIIFAFDQKTK